MDSQDRELLEKTFRLAEENNAMLRKIRRSMRWSWISRALYWVLLIGISIGAFYFVQPYIDQLMGVYGGIQGDVQNIQGLFDQYRGVQE